MMALPSLAVPSEMIGSSAPVVDLDDVRRSRRAIGLGHVRPGHAASGLLTEAIAPQLVAGSPSLLEREVDRGERVRLHARRSPTLWGSVLVSVCLHLAGAAVLSIKSAEDGMGIGGVEPEGISVEIVSATALESRALRVLEKSEPLPTTMTEAPPFPTAAAPVELTPQAERDPTQPEAPKVSPEPDAGPLPPSEVKRPPQEHEPERETANNKAINQPQPVATPLLRPAGDALSMTPTKSETANVAAGASRGTLSRYAVEIRLALGKVRPRHGGDKGRVLISFGLDEQGEVRFVRIVQSGGSPGLDASAVQAVRNARFPVPPASMTEQQRTYTVPFDFK